MSHKLFIHLLLLIILTFISSFKPQESSNTFTFEQKVKEAQTFCITNNLNKQFCILIDFSIHSGKTRFYVWDFNQEEVILSGLVGHGCGSQTWSADETKDTPKFSNADGSHLSSLGKYKIGKRGESQWGVGINYQLFGLEKTNNNAFKRNIVFHSWELMSDVEIYPKGSPEGWGCPTLSNKTFLKVDKLLKVQNKETLMWCYK